MNYDPQTGKPLHQTPWRRFRRQSWFVQVLGWAGVVVIGLTILGAIVGGGSKSQAGAASSPARRVSAGLVKIKRGSMGFSGVYMGDEQARHKLGISRVYCAWRGGHVVVHAVFNNPLAASIKISVNPAYDLADAGTHGDADDLTAHVGAHGRLVWVGDAGHPQGVVGRPRIARCYPEVFDIGFG